nr:helix-turn-helix domain-containing protein [Parashewanella hymeniacidonis]
MLVTSPHRAGYQPQYIELPIPTNYQDQKLADTLEHIRNDLTIDITIDELSDKLNMSRSTFTRHFKKHTGLSFNQWLLQHRLSHSQTLLEQSKQSIEQIAESAGFKSVVTFRHHFKEKFKVSPSQWRAAFYVTAQ